MLAAGLGAAAASPAPTPAVATAPALSAASTRATSPGPPPGIPKELFTMAPATPCPEQLCFSASSNQPGVPSFTASRTHMVMINPDIVDTARGVAHITTDRAEENGADFGNSHIELTGDVHADLSEGQLSAATATVQVVDKRIESITAQGSPARFLRRGEPPTPVVSKTSGGQAASPAAALSTMAVYGHADSITYDLKADSVQLNGNSWLTDGCNEFTSQRITYNMMSQTVQAGPAPGSRGRVYGTIRNTHAGTGCAAPAGKS